MSFIQMPEPDRALMARREPIVRELERRLGKSQVIADEDGRRTYETDALTAYRCMPLAVVLPRTTAEVQAVLAYCYEAGIKVVARGAGTSICGGALPSADAIVVCLSRMSRILAIDYDNRTARVEAGITNLAISSAVSARGYFYAPDPSSQLACTLGGNIAMNSGGAHCLKYGVTTNNVLGLKLVLITGEVVDIGGDHLESGGYDLLSLVIGSEGQFGLITEATVRLCRVAPAAKPVMLGFASAQAAGACVAAIIGSGILPVAIEFMDRPAIAVCEAFAHAGYPLDVEALLIVEVEGVPDEIDPLLAEIVRICEPYEPMCVIVSSGPEHSARIWKGRKAAFGALGRISDYYCMDGVIPLARLADVLGAISTICDEKRLKVANIFHAGDGNLHPMVLYNANDAGEAQRAEEAGAEILRLCVSVGGCLTGEHGVGIEKRDLMHAQFTADDLSVQMRIKAVFDPHWLLNPGKVFPLPEQAAMQAASKAAERASRGSCDAGATAADASGATCVAASAPVAAEAGRDGGWAP